MNRFGTKLLSINEEPVVNRPLPVLAVFFILGIIASGILEKGVIYIFLIALVILVLAWAGFIVGWSGVSRLILLLALLCGMIAGGVTREGVERGILKFSGHHVTLQGTVERAPSFRRDGVEYILAVDTVTAGGAKHLQPGLVLVRVRDTERAFRYGDRLRVRGFLSRPREPGNPGAFNYRKYLERRGIVALMTVGAENVHRLERGTAGFLSRVYTLRDKLMEINRKTLSPEHAAMLNGMMFGSRGEIPRDLQEAFSEAGLAHLLCVSGLHTGLVLGGVLLLASLLGLPAARIPLVAVPVLFFYAAMTGFGPAVLRAAVMALLLIFAHRLGRERDWPTALAVAALVILAVNPLQIYEIGFQLSFAATWGILYLGPWLREKMTSMPLPEAMKAVLWVTVAAQLATLPLIVQYFNLVSLVSVPANLVAVPAAGITLFMGFAAGLAGLLVLPAATVINSGTAILLSGYQWLVLLVREIPGATVYLPPPPLWVIVAWYGALAVAVWWPKARTARPVLSRVKCAAALAAALALAVFFLWSGVGKDRLEVHFINVGQGDSILVKLPGGKNMLVDAGGWTGEFEGDPGAGDYVVVPYLKRQGINQLDALLISHFHEDHAGGITAVMEAVKVERLVVPPLGKGENSDPDIKRILHEAGQQKIPIHTANYGDELFPDSPVQISFLGPPEELFTGTRSDMNNNSLVLLLDFRETEFLLTGDIEEEMQNWLVQRGVLTPVEVLKVPHHGSRFSSPDFFKRLSPQVAVISVGERNLYNLPSEEVISRLQDLGAKVYRTDRDGAKIITVPNNNSSFW